MVDTNEAVPFVIITPHCRVYRKQIIKGRVNFKYIMSLNTLIYWKSVHLSQLLRYSIV